MDLSNVKDMVFMAALCPLERAREILLCSRCLWFPFLVWVEPNTFIVEVVVPIHVVCVSVEIEVCCSLFFLI